MNLAERAAEAAEIRAAEREHAERQRQAAAVDRHRRRLIEVLKVDLADEEPLATTTGTLPVTEWGIDGLRFCVWTGTDDTPDVEYRGRLVGREPVAIRNGSVSGDCQRYVTSLADLGELMERLGHR